MITVGEISEHLERRHWFPYRMDLDKVPDQFPLSARSRGADHGRKVKTATSQRICPNPSRWSDVFEQLLEYAEAHACPTQPPKPLILAGWAYTNDTHKMRRWRETVDWASANGCEDIVKGLSDNDFYEIEEPTNYSFGPMGGPCYRPWDFIAKVRPTKEELTKCFEYMSAHWADIAGSRLASVTRPLTFTGKKARRLLVQAEEKAVPPWGRWTYLSTDEQERRTFTRFRAAVNEKIAPHEVDHIEFVTEPE
jgi:hypothetical protein